MENKVHINANVGETFKVGKYELIRFPEKDGGVRVVFRNTVFDSVFGKSNNLAKSEIMEKLKDVLAEVEDIIGAENVLEFDTDLISIDGSRKHGILRTKISLPTFDFYRENRAIFEKHKIDEWWWLATPWETSEYTDDDWIACVSPLGRIYFDRYFSRRVGVRPFLVFSSSIFGSCEE